LYEKESWGRWGVLKKETPRKIQGEKKHEVGSIKEVIKKNHEVIGECMKQVTKRDAAGEA